MKRIESKRIKFVISALTLWGCMLSIFSLFVIIERLNIDISGKIVDRKVGKYQSGPHRWYVDYKILSDTGETSIFRSDGNDSSLSREMQVGMYLQKKKYKLDYLLNNNNITDFPILFYSVIGGIGIILLIILGIYIFTLRRENVL